ncbi:unnamed protein product [Moneuplotes crassus]|uniref:Uncharacterized protein n=1 Tax=Euplotes crassus TaxID=5936 RepID=A0AAD2D530_EUPCR|nr:unnamed protein product [Moneuplotes crassus]
MMTAYSMFRYKVKLNDALSLIKSKRSKSDSNWVLKNNSRSLKRNLILRLMMFNILSDANFG